MRDAVQTDNARDKKVNFDVETAINTLRQAGYYSHALYLAEKHRNNGLYLKIQYVPTPIASPLHDTPRLTD